MSKTFFFASNPTFSSIRFSAISPRDTTSLLISVESLIELASLSTLSNNLLRIFPEASDFFESSRDF